MLGSSITPSKSSGEILRASRVAKGLGLAELAQMADISRTYLWRIETSSHVPGYEIAKKLADALGTRAAKIWPELNDVSEAVVDSGLRSDQPSARERGTMDDFNIIVRVWLEVQASVAQSAASWPARLSSEDEEALAHNYIEKHLSPLLRQRASRSLSPEADEVAVCLLSAADFEAKTDHEGAIEALLRARILTGDPDNVARIDWNLGRCYQESHNYGLAILSLEQALRRFKKSLIEPAEMASLETHLGWLHYRAARYEVAKQYFDQGRKGWAEVRPAEASTTLPDEGCLEAERGLASVLERQGDLREADALFRENLARAINDVDRPQIAWNRARLGFLHIHTGDWQAAESEMDEAFVESGVLIEAASKFRGTLRMGTWLETLRQMIWNNRGLLKFRQGKYQDSILSCTEGLDIAQRLKDPRGEAFGHLFLAQSYAAGREWDEAKHHVRTAERLFRQMTVLHYLPETLSLQAEIELEKTGAKSALAYLYEALGQVTGPDTRSFYQEGFVRRTMGAAKAKLGDLDEARIDLETSVSLLAQAGDHYELALSHLAFVDVLLQRNELDLAAQQISESRKLAKDLGVESLDRRGEQLQVELNNRRQMNSQ